jgi:hypothetical protein
MAKTPNCVLRSKANHINSWCQVRVISEGFSSPGRLKETGMDIETSETKGLISESTVFYCKHYVYNVMITNVIEAGMPFG